MVEVKDILNFLIVILLFFFLTLKERSIIFIFKFIIFFLNKRCSLHSMLLKIGRKNSLSWSKGVTYETSEAAGEEVWTDPFQSSGSEGPEFLFFP